MEATVPNRFPLRYIVTLVGVVTTVKRCHVFVVIDWVKSVVYTSFLEPVSSP